MTIDINIEHSYQNVIARKDVEIAKLKKEIKRLKIQCQKRTDVIAKLIEGLSKGNINV